MGSRRRGALVAAGVRKGRAGDGENVRGRAVFNLEVAGCKMRGDGGWRFEGEWGEMLEIWEGRRAETEMTL